MNKLTDEPLMIDIKVHCRSCRIERTIQVPLADCRKWQDGEAVQRAFPYLAPGTRELLISQICEECFDEMFKE